MRRLLVPPFRTALVALAIAPLTACIGVESGDGVQPSNTSAPMRAGSDVAIFAYHVARGEVRAIMAERGCYEPQVVGPPSGSAAVKVALLRGTRCDSRSDEVRFRIADVVGASPPSKGILLVNPTTNAAPSDGQICENERLYIWRRSENDAAYEEFKRQDYAPYLVDAADRNSLTHFYPCAEAAPRLRAQFYVH